MNFKVRIKNPVFWMTVIPAMATFLYTLLGMMQVVPPISQEELVQALGLVISALTTLGVLVDPTTSGVKDSARAMTYETPADSDNVY